MIFKFHLNIFPGKGLCNPQKKENNKCETNKYRGYFISVNCEMGIEADIDIMTK